MNDIIINRYVYDALIIAVIILLGIVVNKLGESWKTKKEQ
jgi:isoprenylcysteine carboxyl methyltransferase (ICMT) family protein YpbQ